MIYNLGSLNIDHVYDVPHFVAPGETLHSVGYGKFPGGKGFNQTIALLRAGAPVTHIGCCGEDAQWMREMLEEHGCMTAHLKQISGPSGHAIIQVTPEGQNSILLASGANSLIEQSAVISALHSGTTDDIFLTQNETAEVPFALEHASARGLRIALNVAPASERDRALPLESVDFLFVNEVEGAALVGDSDPTRIILGLAERCSRGVIVLTLGAAGAWIHEMGETRRFSAIKAAVVDTTAAGDTFVGYFLAAIHGGATSEQAMHSALRGASICVTRKGAASSIPWASELQ